MKCPANAPLVDIYVSNHHDIEEGGDEQQDGGNENSIVTCTQNQSDQFQSSS